MSHQAFIEYIRSLTNGYKKADKIKKSQYLDHAVEVCRKDRKTIIRYLGQEESVLQARPSYSGRGRKRIYDLNVLQPHIKNLWVKMERINGRRMKAALDDWLPDYEHPDFGPEQRKQLLLMSAATMERVLSLVRRSEEANKGLPTTTSAIRALKNKVPINTLDHKASKPGFTQADTVAHCGSSAKGSYANSLTLVDLKTSWTEVRALFTKKAYHVKEALIAMQKDMPFEILAINTDSGSEFINTPIIQYMHTGRGGKAIAFTRSRPYKKNDNAYVEQKNYTHVRQLFGYDRIEDQSLVDLMNEIYTQYWLPLNNFFLPTQKLIEKSRVGSKIVKKFDNPKSPYWRIMESPHISEKAKLELQNRKSKLNPFKLADGLETKLREFFHRLSQTKSNTRGVA